MKRYLKTFVISSLLTLMLLAPSQPAQAGIYEIIKAAVVKAIKAADLKIQRLQNKTIWLQNAQKQLENALSKLKLDEISQWTEKQRKQYDEYFQELWKIKNAISTWQKVKDILARQLQLVEEYKRAWNLLRQDRHFTAQEIQQMYRVYSGILDESLKNIDQLILVASAMRTQMTDGERLEMIDAAGRKLETNLSDLRRFSDRNFKISLSRAVSEQDASLIRKIYGLKD